MAGTTTGRPRDESWKRRFNLDMCLLYNMFIEDCALGHNHPKTMIELPNKTQNLKMQWKHLNIVRKQKPHVGASVF